MRIDHILHNQKDNIDLFNHVFESFPNKDFWKFCIDRKDYHRGMYLSISEVIPHIVEGIEYFQNLKK